jgi:hypothetical protein
MRGVLALLGVLIVVGGYVVWRGTSDVTARAGTSAVTASAARHSHLIPARTKNCVVTKSTPTTTALLCSTNLRPSARELTTTIRHLKSTPPWNDISSEAAAIRKLRRQGYHHIQCTSGKRSGYKCGGDRGTGGDRQGSAIQIAVVGSSPASHK